MPTIDPSELSKTDRHRLLIDGIVPRPIAWVTTLDDPKSGHEAVLNLAPFSYFMGVTSSPPSLALSIGDRSPAKHTLANLRATGEAVVQLVPPEHLETVNQTGAEYPRDVSEVESLNLPTTPSSKVAPPRLAFAEVAFECSLIHEIHIGSPGSTICVLEVLLAHVRDELAQPNGLPDPRKLRAVGRLGERFYLRGDNWEIEDLAKPEVPDDLR